MSTTATPRPRVRVGREKIIEAAAELFARQGYAATSTRDIAAHVGIRQPSLYHHFKLKSDILRELLFRTLTPALEESDRILAGDAEPLDKLVALVDFDVRVLLGGDHNSGALYLMPERHMPEFASFRQARDELRDRYRILVAASIDEEHAVASTDAVGNIVFNLVESVVFRRMDEPETSAEDVVAQTIALVHRAVGRSSPRVG